MTLVFASPAAESNTKAAGTHAFIVGVGKYPYPAYFDPNSDQPKYLNELSSPPLSAKALADWFLSNQGTSPAPTGFRNPDAPLATVQMLLSPGQTYRRPDGQEVKVCDATHDNILKGFRDWRERLKTNDHNIAVFYFCGHGIEGHNDYLLPSDIGKDNPFNPWSDGIDIRDTATALCRLTHAQLYFFIDACREGKPAVLNRGTGVSAVFPVNFSKPVCSEVRLILWAAAEGRTAMGAPGGISRFTKAIIEALSGFEAEEATDGKGWMVTGEILARSVRQIIETENASRKPEGRQYIEAQIQGSQPFHFVTRQPRHVAKGITSIWSVNPRVRQALAAFGGLDKLSAKALEALADQLEARNIPGADLEKEVQEALQLSANLARDMEAGRDTKVAQHAQEWFNAGKLQEARAAYGELRRRARARRDAEKMRLEAEEERIAQSAVREGDAWLLASKPLEALPCYAEAYQLRPSEPQYALRYAKLLHSQNRYQQALDAYGRALVRLRELTDTDPTTYLPDTAIAAEGLALVSLYSERQGYVDLMQEALNHYRTLAEKNRSRYLPEVARVLVEWGKIFIRENFFGEAQSSLNEAISIYRDLTKETKWRDIPVGLRLAILTVFNHLGELYIRTLRLDEAEKILRKTYVQLFCLPDDDDPDMKYIRAILRGNQGRIFQKTCRFSEAEKRYNDALTILRQITPRNPSRYEPALAEALRNLGGLYTDIQSIPQAEKLLNEAWVMLHELAKKEPRVYWAGLARTRASLGDLYASTLRFAEAETAYNDALDWLGAIEKYGGGRLFYPLSYKAEEASFLTRLGGVIALNPSRRSEAHDMLSRALGILRSFKEEVSRAYRPELARTLFTLGNSVYCLAMEFEKAKPLLSEAADIYRDLMQSNRAAYLMDLWGVVNVLATMQTSGNKDNSDRRYAEEAAALHKEIVETTPAFDRRMKDATENLAEEIVKKPPVIRLPTSSK